MPTLRTVLAIPALLGLLLAPTTTGDTSAAGETSAAGDTSAARATDMVLPLLTGRDETRAAALLDRTGTRSHYAAAGRGIARADHFRAGSITKTFIAVVVLQLAAQNRLSLSDPVERYLPGLLRGPGTDGRRITLRALLTHTSGLPDFVQTTRGTVPLTPLQAVRIALALPPARAGRFSYSSTNYVLLGQVIRQVTGRSYADEARRRIITPLRLTGTSFPGARTTLPSPHGRAFAADGSDVTRLDPRVAGAAGELVTTLADLDRFYAALLGGRLLPPRRLREMLDTRATHGLYGMGIFPAKLPCGITVWGHNGRISGSYVRTAATVDGRRVLTFRVNTDAMADARLQGSLLAAEFCPRTR
ncbi:serine hydrolase [Streptomyces sp. NK08204]|uniref:serine hydrolase domain-containing protein n=1 Tax=Streptomyces sp. NK08204 TaxID=2873260 RepID=UPI001CECB6BD|nr:serine hydrolase domain-containing protein [Streptomyces sp. NK08204]